MKILKSLLLALTVFLSFTTLKAQEDEKAKLDTIYMLGRKVIVAEVRYVSAGKVLYLDPETSEQKSLFRKEIHKIHYSTGRKEKFNQQVVMDIEEGDWKMVVVTRKKKEVAGLFELGKVSGQSSPGSTNAKSATKTATIRMQKRAANIGAVTVLITKEEAIGGFGDEPSILVEGIAYGFEPPKEEKKDDKKSDDKKKKKKKKR